MVTVIQSNLFFNNTINMKQEFAIAQEDIDKIISINKEGGDPVMFLSGGISMGRTLQEKVNDFWKDLGKRMGFDWSTVSPGYDKHHFMAEPKSFQ